LFEWAGGANVSVTTYVAWNTTCRNYTTTKTDLAAQTATGYKWYANDTSTAWATALSDTYTVSKGTLAGTISSPDVTYPTSISATGSESNAGDTDVNYQTCCGSTCTAGKGPNNYAFGAGAYSCVFNTTAGTYSNWTQSSNLQTDSVTVNQGSTTATLYLNDSTSSQTSVYPNSTVNATATSSVSGLYVQIWRNGTLIANTTNTATNITQWGAWSNNFTAKVLGNVNYSDSASVMLWWNVSKGGTNTSLYLNGTEGNKSYNISDAANFTVSLNVSGKTVKLASDYTGWALQSDTTPLMNYTILNSVGDWYNLTGYFEGDENYSSSSKTYFFNVTVAMPPQWVAGSNSTNTTLAGQPANLTLNWTDNYQLAGYIFSTNNTGTWSNSSYITFSGTTNTSWNVTTLNSTVGSIVSWCFYANDTSGNMNATNCQAGNEFYLNTTEAIVSFTVRLPDNINYSSSTSGGSTADEEFNATSSTIANVTPCIRGDPSKCQTQLLANFIVNNTGNLNENITICLNQSLSSKFAVWGTLTGDPYNSVNIIPNCSYSAWKANESLLINAVDEFWIWTNFTGASTDDSTARMLYINSTQSGA
jgi:hypothetical protein